MCAYWDRLTILLLCFESAKINPIRVESSSEFCLGLKGPIYVEFVNFNIALDNASPAEMVPSAVLLSGSKLLGSCSHTKKVKYSPYRK